MYITQGVTPGTGRCCSNPVFFKNLTGGYILFNISLKYLEEWKLFKDGAIDADIQRNIDAGIWKSVAKDNIPYWKDESCLLYTITV